jgi:hypothetical protein
VSVRNAGGSPTLVFATLALGGSVLRAGIAIRPARS